MYISITYYSVFRSTFRTIFCFPVSATGFNVGYDLCCPSTSSSSCTSTQTKSGASCLQLPICTNLQCIHIALLHKLCCTIFIWLLKLRLVSMTNWNVFFFHNLVGYASCRACIITYGGVLIFNWNMFICNSTCISFSWQFKKRWWYAWNVAEGIIRKMHCLRKKNIFKAKMTGVIISGEWKCEPQWLMWLMYFFLIFKFCYKKLTVYLVMEL
jgi:hypothetical protein